MVAHTGVLECLALAIRPRFVTARILPRAPRKNLHANSVANPGQRGRLQRRRNQFCGLAVIIECGVNK